MSDAGSFHRPSKKGKPMARHVPTPEQRANVTVLTGLGATVEMIAGLLNVEPDTVKTCYRKELEQGPDAVRLEAMRQLFNASKAADGAGRVTAAVKLLDMLARDDQAIAESNTIRITDKTRMVYYGICDPPSFDLFTREGERAIWVYTTGANDGV
jgi:hypothetical protein